MIKKLFEKWLCGHQWETHHTTKIFDPSENRHGNRPVEIRETLICKQCGKIKQISL